jgi:hypothetical protein
LLDAVQLLQLHQLLVVVHWTQLMLNASWQQFLLCQGVVHACALLWAAHIGVLAMASQFKQSRHLGSQLRVLVSWKVSQNRLISTNA